MSIRISQSCIGCGGCASVCPGSLIRVRGGRAEIPNPELCWGCVSCAKECPASAISFYLGEDMGGLGGSMTVAAEDTRLRWTITTPDGGTHTRVVDSKDANKY
jgi:adenylylsulfate reductase subunit B